MEVVERQEDERTSTDPIPPPQQQQQQPATPPSLAGEALARRMVREQAALVAAQSAALRSLIQDMGKLPWSAEATSRDPPEAAEFLYRRRPKARQGEAAVLDGLEVQLLQLMDARGKLSRPKDADRLLELMLQAGRDEHRVLLVEVLRGSTEEACMQRLIGNGVLRVLKQWLLLYDDAGPASWPILKRLLEVLHALPVTKASVEASGIGLAVHGIKKAAKKKAKRREDESAGARHHHGPSETEYLELATLAESVNNEWLERVKAEDKKRAEEGGAAEEEPEAPPAPLTRGIMFGSSLGGGMASVDGSGAGGGGGGGGGAAAAAAAPSSSAAAATREGGETGGGGSSSSSSSSSSKKKKERERPDPVAFAASVHPSQAAAPPKLKKARMGSGGGGSGGSGSAASASSSASAAPAPARAAAAAAAAAAALVGTRRKAEGQGGGGGAGAGAAAKLKPKAKPAAEGKGPPSRKRIQWVDQAKGKPLVEVLLFDAYLGNAAGGEEEGGGAARAGAGSPGVRELASLERQGEKEAMEKKKKKGEKAEEEEEGRRMGGAGGGGVASATAATAAAAAAPLTPQSAAARAGGIRRQWGKPRALSQALAGKGARETEEVTRRRAHESGRLGVGHLCVDRMEGAGDGSSIR